MAATRIDLSKLTTLEIMQALQDKTRELIPFSENQVGGSRLKKKILLFLGRHQQSAETKSYYQLKLNPGISGDENELLPIQKNNHMLAKKTLASIFNHVSSQPIRQIKRRNGQEKTPLEIIENRVKNSVRHGVGNCAELAQLLFLLIRELPVPAHLHIFCELLHIDGRADHVFAVINRDQDSNLKDLTTWGADAIICDPWFREAVNVFEQLKLPLNKRSNIILFLSLYQKEEWHLSVSTNANERYPHSEHWYNKRPCRPYFITQQPNVVCAFAELKQPYPLALLLVYREHLDLLKLLVYQGIALEKVSYLNVPLIFHALGGSVSVIKLLLENKVDPNVRLKTGLNPLEWAASREDQKELKELLLKHAITKKPAEQIEFDDVENKENLSSHTSIKSR